MWNEIEHRITGPGRVESDFGDHVIRSDHPREGERDGRPPEPWRLFLASIGACVASFVDHHCREEGIGPEEIRIVQRQEFTGPERTLGTIGIEVRLPEGFPPKHRDGVLAAAERCTVKRVIEAGMRVRISLAE